MKGDFKKSIMVYNLSVNASKAFDPLYDKVSLVSFGKDEGDLMLMECKGKKVWWKIYVIAVRFNFLFLMCCHNHCS